MADLDDFLLGPVTLSRRVALDPDLDPVDKAVLLVIASHAAADGWAWPSLARFRECTDLSVDTVRARLRSLAAREVIVSEPRTRPDGGTTSPRYRLLDSPPPPVPQEGGPSLPTLGGGRKRPAATKSAKPSDKVSPPLPSDTRGAPPVPQEGAPPVPQEGKNVLQLNSTSLHAARARRPRSSEPTSGPPELDATRAYFRTLGCPEPKLELVADNCHDYWASRGWRRGRDPIRDWHATCRQWWRNECQRNPLLAAAARRSSSPAIPELNLDPCF